MNLLCFLKIVYNTRSTYSIFFILTFTLYSTLLLPSLRIGYRMRILRARKRNIMFLRQVFSLHKYFIRSFILALVEFRPIQRSKSIVLN
jgi:hypothetical protein